MSIIAIVDEKGAVLVPKEILRESDLEPGDRLEVTGEDGNIILRPASENVGESLLEILHGLRDLPICERARSQVRDVRL